MGCEQYIDLFIVTNARHNILEDNTKIKEPYIDIMLPMQNLFFFLYCTVQS